MVRVFAHRFLPPISGLYRCSAPNLRLAAGNNNSLVIEIVHQFPPHLIVNVAVNREADDPSQMLRHVFWGQFEFLAKLTFYMQFETYARKTL